MKSMATRMRTLALATLIACGLVVSACTTPDPEPSDPPDATPSMVEEPDFEALESEALATYQGYMDTWGEMFANASADSTPLLEFATQSLAEEAAGTVSRMIDSDQTSSGAITVTGFVIDTDSSTHDQIEGLGCIDRSSQVILEADGTRFVGVSAVEQVWILTLQRDLDGDGFIITELTQSELTPDEACGTD